MNGVSPNRDSQLLKENLTHQIKQTCETTYALIYEVVPTLNWVFGYVVQS